MNNSHKTTYLLSGIMLIFSLLVIFPFVLMLLTSVKTMSEVVASSFVFIPKHISLINYIDAMNRGNWLRYFYNSIFVTIITVLVSLIINSLAGYSFSRINFRGRNLLFIISLIALMVPTQVTMIPLFILLKNFPLVGGNNILGQGGIGFFNSYLGMILPYIAGPFGVFLFRQFYLNYPKSLDDAAAIDGLNRIRAFYYIYVPLGKPIFAVLAALKATSTWTEYTWPLIITNNDNMKTVQLALTMFKDDTSIIWNQLMAATTLITIPLVIAFLLAQKYFVEGIVTTGIKG